MKLKYYSLGTIIRYDNVKLMVIRQKHNDPACAGCYFSDIYRKFNRGKSISCIVHRLACTKHYRYDHNHVIFRLLSE